MSVKDAESIGDWLIWREASTGEWLVGHKSTKNRVWANASTRKGAERLVKRYSKKPGNR